MFGRLTPFVKKLLMINIGIFFIQSFMNLDLDRAFALYSIYSSSFQPYQMVTYMFLHADLMHVLSNMIGLFFFGPLLEQFLGDKKFLILYGVAALGGAVLWWGIDLAEMNGLKNDVESYLADPNPESFSRFMLDYQEGVYAQNYEIIAKFDENPNDPRLIASTSKFVRDILEGKSNSSMRGASGAIFGILAAFGLLFPNTEIRLIFLPMFPIRAKYLIGAFMLYELYAEFARTPGDSVAHLAHLGGALMAFILIRIWKLNRNSFY